MKKPKQPLRNLYYLHFLEPVAVDEVEEVFRSSELSVSVTPVFPGSFLLASDFPYSEIKHALAVFYTDASGSPTRIRAIMKLKGESKPEVSRLPAEDATTATQILDSGNP